MEKKEATALLNRMNMELRQSMFCTIRSRETNSTMVVSQWASGVQAKEHMKRAISHWDNIRTNGWTIRNGKIDKI